MDTTTSSGHYFQWTRQAASARRPRRSCPLSSRRLRRLTDRTLAALRPPFRSASPTSPPTSSRSPSTPSPRAVATRRAMTTTLRILRTTCNRQCCSSVLYMHRATWVRRRVAFRSVAPNKRYNMRNDRQRTGQPTYTPQKRLPTGRVQVCPLTPVTRALRQGFRNRLPHARRSVIPQVWLSRFQRRALGSKSQ